MSEVVAGRGVRVFAAELDVLRGVAAILMIVNHAGFRLLSPQDAISSGAGTAVFIGSFAPVLFFFATGFGIGLAGQGNSRPALLFSLLWKALVLVLADQFFFWRAGFGWGVDFFSFIALSMLVVSAVARLRRPGLAAAALAVTLLGLRYGLGPPLREHIHGNAFAGWLLGTQALDNVAYPLSPWMVYPLLGFVLGRRYQPAGPTVTPHRQPWFKWGAMLTPVLLAAAWAMASSRSGFFRWGTVNAPYFVLSLAVLGAACLLCASLTGFSGAGGRWLALRGVASFAVIPVHYAVLDLYSSTAHVPIAEWPYAALTLGIVVCSFVVSGAIAKALAAPLLARHRRGVVGAALTLILMAAGATIAASNRASLSVAMCVLIGQLAAACLLGLRPQASEASTRRREVAA